MATAKHEKQGDENNPNDPVKQNGHKETDPRKLGDPNEGGGKHGGGKR